MQEELHNRLKNCLQTILELEPDLERLKLPGTFRTELEMLKQHLEHIKQIDFFEEDLKRLEAATAKFLEELRVPFTTIESISAKNRILH